MRIWSGIILSFLLSLGVVLADLTMNSFGFSALFVAQEQPIGTDLEMNQLLTHIASFDSDIAGSSLDASPIASITDEIAASIDEFVNYPNPYSFSSGTTIGYKLDDAQNVTLRVYTITGMLVHESFHEKHTEGGKLGYNRIVFDNSTVSSTLNPGVYLMIIMTDSQDVLAKGKMVVLP